MKRIVALTFVLALPGIAQMQMPMEHTPARPAGAKQEARHGMPQTHPAVPLGQIADGDTSQQPRTIPATPTPLVLDQRVQEQEHPANVTGATDSPMPDLLEDSRSRPAQPLSYFEGKAMASNPTLRQAEAQVRRLHAEARQRGLWDNPQIGYEADHVRGGVYHSGEQGGFVQQTLPIAGQRSAARATMEAQGREAQAVMTEQQVRVESAVRQAFYHALAMQQEVAFRTKLNVVASEMAVMTHQLANIGQADAPDILQSEVEREQAKLDLATAQRAYRKAFAMLAAVSGDAEQPVTSLVGDLEGVPALQSGSAQEVANGSPAVRVAEQEVSVADAAVHSARRQQMPQLTVHAGLQQDNEPLEVSGGRVGIVGVAQAGISVPLWNRNQGAVEAAKAQRASAEAGVSRTRLVLRMQAEQAAQDYENALNQVQRYRSEMLPRAERAYALYRAKYAGMAAAYPQVLVSQRTLFQMQIEYVHALEAAWQSAILLQHGLLRDGLAAPTSVATQGSSIVGE